MNVKIYHNTFHWIFMFKLHYGSIEITELASNQFVRPKQVEKIREHNNIRKLELNDGNEMCKNETFFVSKGWHILGGKKFELFTSNSLNLKHASEFSYTPTFESVIAAKL